MGEKDLVEAGVTDLEGFDAAPREFSFSWGDGAADTSRRQRWRGAVLVDYRDPWELVYFHARNAAWSLAFMLTIGVVGLAVRFAWAVHLAWVPLTFLVLGGLFHLGLRGLDAYLVADPAEQALLAVTDLGPLGRVRARWPRDEVEALVLRTEAGYVRGKDQYGRERRESFRSRTLELLPRGGGDPVPVTPGFTPGPEDPAALEALAEVLGVPCQVLSTEELGAVLAPTGGDEWGMAAGMTLGLFLPGAAAAAVMAVLY